MDYLSDLRQWRARCDVEDTLVHGYFNYASIVFTNTLQYYVFFISGRFSLRGSELGWAKSWLWNLGLGESNSAKFKLRVGLNLKNYKVNIRFLYIIVMLYH